MLDFHHVVNSPGFNVQTFYGGSQATLVQWQTWIKPRGSRMLWLIAVGGGGSGSASGTVAATAGGGGGGGSGAQSSVILPSAFVPDTLFIQAGRAGRVTGTVTTNSAGVAGLPTYVTIEPNTTLTANNTLLFANGGNGAGAAAGTTGGTAGAGGTVAALTQMPLAGRGIYQFFAGQPGAAGGNAGAVGANITLGTIPGLMVSGGAGGGGKTTTFAVGGQITGSGSGEFLPTVLGGIAAAGATPATSGSSLIARNFLMNYGGSGGGSASNTAGGNAGAGGNASPGSGGGGAGASSTNAATLARPGDGGDGFVIVISW